MIAALMLAGCASPEGSPDTPGPAATGSVTITAVGDYSATDDTDAVLRTIASFRPDANLAIGDLSYGDIEPESAWCTYVRERVGADLPFQILAGNHDSLDNPDGDIGQFAQCLPNMLPGTTGDYGREYQFDMPAEKPLIRVVSISPGLTFADGRWDYRKGDAHYEWTENAIDEARAAGIPWVVVAAHNPCWSVGVHSCPGVSDIYQLLIDKRVDLVLHAHEHSYARTFPLVNGVTECEQVPIGSFEPACVAERGNAYEAGSGTVFATVGGGGMPLRESNRDDTEAGYFAAFNGSNIDPAHGVLLLRITAEEIAASFVAAGDGDFRDEFTISR